MWMVRAGKNSFLLKDFQEFNVVAIGWNLGDLTNRSDEEIRQLYFNKYKNNKSPSQIIRFIRDIKVGDYVISFNQESRHYILGKITSDYYHSEIITKTDESDDNYFDLRDVEWLGVIPRDDLRKPTRNALSHQSVVFKVKDNVINDILNNKSMDIISYDVIVSTISGYLEKNSLKNTMADDEDRFLKFKEMFSPQHLKNLKGIDVLNYIFPQKGNKSNLCYNLEFSDDFKWLCGGIRGGSTFKFSLFKYSETNKWTVGSAKSNLKSVSEDKAIEIAAKIRDAIVEGAQYIENNQLESVEDYVELEKELNEIFKDSQKFCPINPTHSWIHKYYSIIFPEKFPMIHSDKMKKEMLIKFRIDPLDAFYANDGQLYELAKKCGIGLYSLFDDEIVGLFFESKSKWNSINEGVLIDLNRKSVLKKYVGDEKRNQIYFGAPGTGKSYNLNQDKDKLLKDFPDNYERVTFHPDYSYANFVGTYKPVPDGKDITYRYVPGPFMRILKKALDKPSEPFLLIIEEINRANVAAVFGDVFQLLDREDNESMYPIDATEDMKTFINEDKIILPGNLFIWATMNSADQGVFPMDTAFKRRWDFKYFSINNNENLIANTKVTLNNMELSWNDLRKAINDELLSYKINEDKLIGPFFAFNDYHNQEIPTETFKDIFKNKIIMYLFEDAARSRRNELFSGVGKNTNITYSQICEEFDKNGIEIFNDSIKDKFLADDGE